MSSEGLATQGLQDLATAESPTRARAPAPPDRPRSFTRRVLGQTLTRWGARLGVAWIAVLVLGAVFAPFLANSHPLLFRPAGGPTTSPLLQNLTAADALLLAVFFTAVFAAAALRRHGFAFAALLVVLTLAVTLPLASWFVLRSPTFTDWFPRLARAASPVLRGAGLYLARGAVWLVLGGLASALLLTRAAPPAKARRLAAAWLLLVSLPLVFWIIEPPGVVVFERYREQARAGRVERMILAPIPYSPTDRLRDEDKADHLPPDRAHLMGTDQFGSDVASSMIHACRIALSIGFVSTGIAVVIGVFIGGLMGYFSGWVDLLGMRLVEVFDAIPTLMLLLMLVAFFGRNEYTLYVMMVIIGFTGWVGNAIFVRAEFLRLRQQDFVHAARACGIPLRSILFRHMLPNGVTPVLISASFGVASAILAESTLSFLGLGLVAEASWGRLLEEALGSGGAFYWWIALYPGLAIFLTVLAYNLLGESLRDAIDPHLNRASAM